MLGWEKILQSRDYTDASHETAGSQDFLSPCISGKMPETLYPSDRRHFAILVNALG
jgi:hypothetical protein